MDNQDLLSGKVAVVQTNENTGRIEHFQTIGKNEDGSYNISYWVSSNSGWGAYHIGSYDAGRAISALLNYQQVHHSDEVSRLGRNPLLPDNDPPKNETVVKEH